MNEIKLDIIIPVFNEESISCLFQLLEKNVRTSFNVLICVDSLDDKTLISFDSNNFLFDINIVLNKGKGVHSAIMTGFEKSNAEAIMVYPADDLINTKIIDKMYQSFLEGNDVVVASRFIKGGTMKGCPLLKNVLVRCGSFTLYLFSCIPVMDASNGFRLFSRKLIDYVEIESNKGFTYSIELLVKARRLRLSISEIPARWEERETGKSNFKLFYWLHEYLKWYFYGLSTFWLRKKPRTVERKDNSMKIS